MFPEMIIQLENRKTAHSLKQKLAKMHRVEFSKAVCTSAPPPPQISHLFVECTSNLLWGISSPLEQIFKGGWRQTRSQNTALHSPYEA